MFGSILSIAVLVLVGIYATSRLDDLLSYNDTGFQERIITDGLDPDREISLAELDAQTVFIVNSYFPSQFDKKATKELFKP